jgi:murein DD-endopeptidase MepM/ murein hydrolase activator NlpD
MQGGEWRVLQGYNGSSHQDRGSLWQYEDSFDLVRTDGSTGGQPTYSPVDGVVRWLDPSTGGIAIDVGDGLAVSLFHIDIEGSITAGDRITQGQYIGTVSGPGGGGNGGTPHIHITAWATDDGGNWSRESIPFEGVAAISGQDFPNNGSSLQWTGTIIRP